MTKEKQIEEMAKEVKIAHDEQKYLTSDKSINAIAEHLYNAGYRKASDVVSEIIDDVKKILLDYQFEENIRFLSGTQATIEKYNKDVARYRAITDAVIFAIKNLNELKKKYTEEN